MPSQRESKKREKHLFFQYCHGSEGGKAQPGMSMESRGEGKKEKANTNWEGARLIQRVGEPGKK